MKSLFNYISIMGVAAFTWVAASDTETYNFPYPMNRLGWADASGKLSIWVNGGWGVDLGNGESLPLRFQFSSMQDRISDGILGMGWWMPLLESTVVQQGENQIRLTALGGQSIYLFADSERGGKFVSLDSSWLAEITGNGGVDVKGAGGWSYSFRDGRISRATSPLGSLLVWIYDNNSTPYAIEGKDGRNLVRVFRGSSGEIDRIEVIEKQDRLNYKLTWSDYPLLNRLLGSDALLGLGRSVSGISVQGEEGRSLDDYSLPVEVTIADGLGAETFYSMSVTRPGGGTMVWTPDGFLKSDGSSSYTYNRGEMGSFKLHRDIDGRVEEYGYNPQKGVVERLSIDGQREFYYHIQSPGGAYGKLRRRERLSDRGTRVTVDTYYYNEYGDPLRRTSHEYELELLWDRNLRSWIVQEGNLIAAATPKSQGEGGGFNLMAKGGQ